MSVRQQVPTIETGSHPRAPGSVPPRCLSDATLRNLLQGGETETGQTAAERHLDQCDACAARLETLAGPLHDVLREARPASPSVDSATLQMLVSTADNPAFARASRPAAHAPRLLPPSASPAPGFESLTPIGRGASGTVYRARQMSLGRDVALKVLFSDQAPRAVARAQHEAQMVAGLQHPHLITIYEAELLQEPPYLVMEWISGGSLQDRLKKGPLSIAEVSLLAWQLAQGVAAFHAVGIVHRDLKPANVLLATDSAGSDVDAPPFCAKITDFGLARAVNALSQGSQEGTAIGTPAYMSPEQTRLRPTLGPVGQASDLYGVGAVLFAALTGRPPHNGETPLATLMAAAWEEPPWLPTLRPEVPTDLATIVAKCLRSQPAERYRTSQELLDDLQRFRHGLPIAARTYSRREQLRNWIRRHPTLSLGLGFTGTLLIAALLGVGYHLVRLDRTLNDLQLAQRRAETALKLANEAAVAEESRRKQAVQQAIREADMAHQVMLWSISDKAQPNPNDAKVLGIIRRFYHQHLGPLDELEPDLAEVLGQGLLTCCTLEAKLFKNPQDVLDDTDLALRLLARFPAVGTAPLRRSQILLLRWRALLQQGRHFEAHQTLPDLSVVLDESSPEAPRELSIEHASGLIAFLWNDNQPETALGLASRILRHELQETPPRPRTAESWTDLLSIKAQQLGLLHHLERWSEANDALASWRQLAAAYQSEHPAAERGLAIQQLRLLAQHLRHAHPHLKTAHLEADLAFGNDCVLKLLREDPADDVTAALAALEWVDGLAQLPAELASPEWVDFLGVAALHRTRSLLPLTEGVNLTKPLLDMREQRAKRAFQAGRFAEALYESRETLTDLTHPATSQGRSRRELCQQACDLAARACHELGLPAEELSYLSRAASLAQATDRVQLEARLQQALQSVTATTVLQDPATEEPSPHR